MNPSLTSFLMWGWLLSLATANAATPKAGWQKYPAGVNASDRNWHAHGTWHASGTKPPFYFCATNIPSFVAGTETNGSVRVSYSSGLTGHAILLAQMCERALRQVEMRLALSPVSKPHLYLVHLPEERRAIRFHLPFGKGLRTIPWLLPMTNTAAAIAYASSNGTKAILNDLSAMGAAEMLFALTHEIYEMHLVNSENPLALLDFQIEGKWYRQHTRWFREGLANYAAYVFDQAFHDQVVQVGLPKDVNWDRGNCFDRPFSELARCGTTLFDWDQEAPPANLGHAALGLFLLIEHRKGSDAIAAVLKELPRLERPNGKSILQIFKQRANLDLKRLTRDLEFPSFGITFRTNPHAPPIIRNVGANSQASRTGLKVDDTVLQVNGHATAGMFDYEWQVFHAVEAGENLVLTVSRQGRQYAVALGPPVRK